MHEMPDTPDTPELFKRESPGELNFLEPVEALHEDQRDLMEVLIFSSPDPLDTGQLAEKLGWTQERVLGCVDRLNEEYEEQGRSFELVRLAEGWQLVSRRRYGSLLSSLLKEQVRPRLSRAALETLAVLAYRQPVTKGDVEAVRGVKADGVIRTLLERDLIQITGRADGVGRPLLYKTTRAFLETFGLVDLKGLPRRKEVDEWLKGLKEAGQDELPPDALVERRPTEAGDDPDPQARSTDVPSVISSEEDAAGSQQEPTTDV